MLSLDRLVREPSDLAVAASFRRLTEAIRSGDQARIDLVLAEISGLAAREARGSEGTTRGPVCLARQPTSSPGRCRE
jgi:hypothetical protein